MIPGETRISFLSHLCGEEGVCRLVDPQPNFLSHLCGEEGPVQANCHVICFLSHLCGEEVRLRGF